MEFFLGGIVLRGEFSGGGLCPRGEEYTGGREGTFLKRDFPREELFRMGIFRRDFTRENIP